MKLGLDQSPTSEMEWIDLMIRPNVLFDDDINYLYMIHVHVNVRPNVLFDDEINYMYMINVHVHVHVRPNVLFDDDIDYEGPREGW